MLNPSVELQKDLAAAPVGDVVGEMTREFGDRYVPMTLHPFDVPIDFLPPSPVEPGTSVSGGDVGRVIPAEIVYTQASQPSDEDCQMEVTPVGSPVNLIWENAAAHGQTGLRLQNYREVAQSLDGFEGLLPVVIGEYSSSTVDMGVDGVSYVPLGA